VRRLAVGFDFDHTLGVDHALERTTLIELLQQIAASRGRAFDERRAAEIADAQIAQYRSGACTLAQAFDAAFEAMLEGPASAEAFVAFKRLTIERTPQHVEALPGAAELLRALDRVGIPHAILTNGWNPLQQCKADLVGFAAPVLVSDDLGVRKPSVQAFDALRECLEAPPENIWYIGDDPYNDVLGALGAGMRAIWFDWEGKKYPTNVPAPTAIVTQLEDVLRVIM